MDGSFLQLTLLLWIFHSKECYGSKADCPSKSTDPRAATRLRENLLCNYDSHSRPVKNMSSTVPVYLLLDLQGIDMDEHGQTLSVNGILRFMWVDQWLVWNPIEYEKINFLRVESDQIWVPDLTVNVLRLHGLEDVRPHNCVASFSGIVSCFPKVTIDAPCTQDMRLWPYDQHNCSFALSSYVYFQHQMNITTNDPGIGTINLQNNRVWTLQQFKVTREEWNLSLTGRFTNASIFYPTLEYNFLIRRNSDFYVAATVLPACMMLILVLTTFWMGSMTSSRITICGFLILTCGIFLSYLLYLVPANGTNVPVIMILFRDSMALAVFAAIITVIQRRMQTAVGLPPAWLLLISDWLQVNFLGRLLLLDNVQPQRDDESAILEPTGKISAWVPCALLLDRVAFIVSLIVTIVLFLGYLP